MSEGDNSEKAALQDANRLIDRLQDETVAPLKPGATPADAEEALLNITDELEGPAVENIRESAGETAHYGSAGRPSQGVAHPTDAELQALVTEGDQRGTAVEDTSGHSAN